MAAGVVNSTRLCRAVAHGTATTWHALKNRSHIAQVNNFTFHYAFYVVMNWLPTYFDHVLRANLADLGPIKTLPYLIMFAMSNVGNACGDWLITSRKWSVAAARKAVNTTGALPACLLHLHRHSRFSLKAHHEQVRLETCRRASQATRNT